MAQEQVVTVMVDAHVTQETCWQKEGRILHGTLSTFPCEGKLSGEGKKLSAEVAMLLLLDDECVLVHLFVVLFVLLTAWIQDAALLGTLFPYALNWSEVALLGVVAMNL